MVIGLKRQLSEFRLTNGMRFCHLSKQLRCLSLLYLRSQGNLRGGNLTRVKAQRKGSKPFSWVKSRQLLDPRKTWNVLSNRVCGERPTKYFSRNKLPTRFPEDIVRIKRSALQTVDGGPFMGKRLQKMKSSSFGLIAIFLRHAPDSQLFHGNIFERLRCFINSLDLSVCEDQAIGTSKGILKSLRLL